MTAWVYLSLALSAVLPWAARWTTPGLHPAVAVRALTLTAVTGAVAWTTNLLMLALTLFDDLPPLSAFDDRPELGLPKPVPGWVALVAGLVLATGALRAVRQWWRRRQVVAGLRRAGRPRHGLVIADSADPVAVAVPGNPGHILITSGMLRLLSDRERQAVFAHEQAHLRHRHHRWVTATVLAAAAHPALSQLTVRLSHLTERWADEEAARATGDRELVARAIAKAALATPPAYAGGRTGAPLGAHGTGPAARVAAMYQPPCRSRWQRLTALVTVCAAVTATTAAAAAEFYQVAAAWIGIHLAA